MTRTEYFMAVTVMLLPLGIVIFLQGGKFASAGIGMAILGMACWLAGLYFLNKENEHDTQLKIALLELLNDIRNELKGLREDNNEHTNKPK